MSEVPVASPCIGVCVLNLEDCCEGCFRTSEEITDWGAMSDDERRNVLRLSWQRARDRNRLL